MPDYSDRSNDLYIERHIRFGWRALLFFALTGLVLESLHAFKFRWYLDASNETRRMLLTLTHAHGVLLALVNIVFGFSQQSARRLSGRRLSLASASLFSSTVMLPGGFLLGGLVVYGGDPGLGVFLVPIGATLLILALILLAS
jgi:hypothetical protein